MRAQDLRQLNASLRVVPLPSNRWHATVYWFQGTVWAEADGMDKAVNEAVDTALACYTMHEQAFFTREERKPCTQKPS